MTETLEDLRHLVDTAETAIREREAEAEADPGRPVYHFRAPSQWMDDPNGIIYTDGWYHMMYSLNPHSSAQRAGMVYKTAVRVWDPQSEDWTGGITVWGHARSRDLVHWEHLPIALYPSIERGEHFIWFGCTVLDRAGDPLAIYTAVGPQLRPEDTAQQWASRGTRDLLSWTPLESNPLLTDDVHGDDVITEWRDPFLFRADGRDFMILGGRSGDGAPVVALYEAEDAQLTRWTYRGIVFTYPDATFPSAECPNLVEFGDRWLLLVSTHGPAEYFVGDLDVDAVRFTPQRHGRVDASRSFYATNVLEDGVGRRLMWGAVEGFENTRGWNGCVSLPREITVDEAGELVQRVAPELESLHGARLEVRSSGSAAHGVLVTEGTAHVRATIESDLDDEFRLTLSAGDGSLEIALGAVVTAGRYRLARAGAKTTVDVWIDKTVVEVFVDDRAAATSITPLWSGPLTVALAGPGSAIVEAWALDARGLFSDSAERMALFA